MIAYASKYGATKEIAECTARILEHEGITLEVKEADAVSSLQPYDAIVLGSALYFDHWLPEASELLESFQEELAKKPVWLFSSGLTGDDQFRKGKKDWLFPEALQSIVETIKPKDITLFAGKVDAEGLTLNDWLINPSVRVEVGDYRNWAEIEAWAKSIAHSLKKENMLVHS